MLERKLVKPPAPLIDFNCISRGGSSICYFQELAFLVEAPSQHFSCPHLLYTSERLKTSIVFNKMDVLKIYTFKNFTFLICFGFVFLVALTIQDLSDNGKHGAS